MGLKADRKRIQLVDSTGYNRRLASLTDGCLRRCAKPPKRAPHNGLKFLASLLVVSLVIGSWPAGACAALPKSPRADSASIAKPDRSALPADFVSAFRRLIPGGAAGMRPAEGFADLALDPAGDAGDRAERALASAVINPSFQTDLLRKLRSDGPAGRELAADLEAHLRTVSDRDRQYLEETLGSRRLFESADQVLSPRNLQALAGAAVDGNGTFDGQEAKAAGALAEPADPGSVKAGAGLRRASQSGSALGARAPAPGTHEGLPFVVGGVERFPSAGQAAPAPAASGKWWFAAATIVMMFGVESVVYFMQLRYAVVYGGAAALFIVSAGRMLANFAGRATSGFLASGGLLERKGLKTVFATAIGLRLLAMSALVACFLAMAHAGPLAAIAAAHASPLALRWLAGALIGLEAFALGITGNGGALELPIFQRLVGNERRAIEQILSVREWINQAASMMGPMIGRAVGDVIGNTLVIALYPVALLAAMLAFVFKVRIPASTGLTRPGASPMNQEGANPVNKTSIWKLIAGAPLMRTASLGFIAFIIVNYLMFQGGVASAYTFSASPLDEAAQRHIGTMLFALLSAGNGVGGWLVSREGRLLQTAMEANEPVPSRNSRRFLKPVDRAIERAYLGRWIGQEFQAEGRLSEAGENRILNKSLALWMTLNAVLALPAFLAMTLANPLFAYAAMFLLFAANVNVLNKLWTLIAHTAGRESSRATSAVSAISTLAGFLSLLLVSGFFSHHQAGMRPFAWLSGFMGLMTLFYFWIIRQFKGHAATRPEGRPSGAPDNKGGNPQA